MSKPYPVVSRKSPEPVWPWLALGLTLAAAVRAVHLYHPKVDADIAVVGLMGLNALQGDFSAFYWGQPYGGSLEALVAAGIFALAGPSPLTLALAPLSISLLYLLGLYLLGQELYGRRGGLAALLIAGLGPFYLIWFSVLARGLYTPLLAMGVWLLWLVVRVCRRPLAGKVLAWHYLAIGIVAGLGAWSHPLAVNLVVPCAIALCLCDRRLLISPRLVVLLAGFFVGSLPFWIYNLTHHWATFRYMAAERPTDDFWLSLQYIVRDSWPVLVGARWASEPQWVAPGLGMLLLALSLVVLVFTIWGWSGQLKKRVLFRNSDGSEVLLLALAWIPVLFCLMGSSASGSQRYLLPFYTLWPLAIVYVWQKGLARGGWARVAAWTMLSLFGAAHLYGSVASSMFFQAEERQERQREASRDQNLINFCKHHGISAAYVLDYWLGPPITFRARGEVVLVLPYGDRRPEYLYRLLRGPAAAIAASGDSPDATQAALECLGARFQREPVGPFTVFWDIRPPGQTTRLLPAQGWRGQARPNPWGLPRAWDLDANTRWSTLASQRPGQDLILDLGRVEPGVAQVLYFCGRGQDMPDRLALSTSQDGETWQAAVSKSEATLPMMWSAGKPVTMLDIPWQELRFPPRPARYVRFELTGRQDWWWSVVEMLVGSQDDTAPAPDYAAAGAWLAARLTGQGRVWAEPGLLAWLPADLRAQHQPVQRPGWLREFLAEDYLLPTDQRLYFALPANLAALAEHVLKDCAWRVSSESAHGVVLLAADPPTIRPPSRPLQKALAPQATSGGLTWDLGRVAGVAGLALHGESETAITPGDLRLETSVDGREFYPVNFKPVLPPNLYWSGLLPLAARPYPLHLGFPPQKSRFLRLSWALPKNETLPPQLRADFLSEY